MRPVDRTPDLARSLSRAAVLTDFDGTLAPIIDDPAAVRPAPGATEVLSEIADRAAVVGIVSGRPVEVLARLLPDPRLSLAGLYGLERRVDGRVVDAPEAARWTEPIGAAAERLGALVPAGVEVEAKRLSLTIHHRRAPEAAEASAAAAAAVAADLGLTVRPARMAVEVHPPGGPDKGTVVSELAAGCAAACFVGDDVGDIPAFTALDRLAAGGAAVVRVAVDGPEAPDALLAAADVVVDGPGGAVGWLRSLVGSGTAATGA